MKKIFRRLTICCSLLLALVLALPVHAARQKLSNDYLDKYFTTVAAASCLGVYLPEKSTEFNYLENNGWTIEPQSFRDGAVAPHFAIATNYFPELDKNIYLVTFRGSASKGDWKINLRTHRVGFGGSSLAEMESIAQMKVKESAPQAHAGFNEYVDKLLHHIVLDEQENFRGIFKQVLVDERAFLILTGHSSGGAAATLLGARLLDLGFPKEKFSVVSFGAPAVGNQALADVYADKLYLLRVTNTIDPIPGSLQTFFGGYKQFGKQIKYEMLKKISSMQHDMAMYFDYSVSEYYRAFDREATLGRLYPLPQSRVTGDAPIVALWFTAAKNLQQIASATDMKRVATDQFRRMLPSYIVMDNELTRDAYVTQDVVRQSREAGADYVLICGVDAQRAPKEKFWYLNVNQAAFDKNGELLVMAVYSKRVSHTVSNVQALGEGLLSLGYDLRAKLPFVRLEHAASLTPNE